MLHGSLTLYDAFGFLTWALAGTFGVFILVADAVAVFYVFTVGELQRVVYWIAFTILILFTFC